MRITHRRTRRRGGALGDFGTAVFSGIKQGIKNAPKEIYSTLRSSGSSYLTPTGSIANYAGNNIQNIIKSHNETFRRDMGNKINALKTTVKSTNKNKKIIQYPMMPISRSYMPKPNLKKYNSKIIYNNKYTYSNKKYNNKNKPWFNNKSTQQQQQQQLM